MSSTTNFTDLFLDKPCYAKLPYMTKNRDTWQKCATQRARVSVNILIVMALLVGLVLLYFWNKQKQEDPDSPFPTGIILVSLFILALLYFLYPMYATRSATVEYDAYETEKAEFLRQNPSLRMQDYLRYKIEEANTRHFGSLAGSQSLMAGAMVADTLSGLFAGGGAGRAGGRR